MTTRIQLRRDTSTNWTTNNPTLALGETGVETDTRKFKFGDGTTAWNSLPYANGESNLDVVDEIGGTSDLELADDNGNTLVRFSNGHIKTKNFNSETITPVETDTPWLDLTGKTIGFLGDSITAGSGASTTNKRYSTVFCEIAKCTERNLGIGGTCLCNNTKNGASANRFLARVTAANLSGLDMLIIFGGTNDFSYDSKAVGDHFSEKTITSTTYTGTKERIANPDNETFSGALHELIQAIRAIDKNLPLVFVTPLNKGIYVTSDYRPTSAQQNSNGDYISDFTDAIKDICAFYSIPVFVSTDHFPWDFTTSTVVNPKVQTTGADDSLHPNDKGHATLARLLYRWIITNCELTK